MTPPSILGNDNRHLLCAALKLNTEQDKELAIRQKIIWGHARDSLNIAETSIPTGALPEVIAWFGDGDPRRTNANIIQYHNSPLSYETIRIIRLDSIYRIARCRSDPIHSRGNTHML